MSFTCSASRFPLPAFAAALALSVAACSSPAAPGPDGGAGGEPGSGGAGGQPGSGGGASGSVSSGSGGGATSLPVTATYTEALDAFPNPERGFHGNFDLGADPAPVRAAGLSLARLYVRLDAYRNKDIDAAELAKITASLAAARAAGLELILRFTYNFPSTYPSTDPDASRDRILGHIAQLAPVLAAGADVIAVVQAGFIGDWGEWHDSTNGLDDDTSAQQAIVSALLGALPKERSIQIRYPNIITAVLGAPLTQAEAFDGSEKSRVGLHDDCFLAGDSDGGTYGRTSSGVGASPAAGKAFLAQIGQFTPIGGETCAVSAPRTDCATAKAELSQMHYSYMNRDFHPDVIAGWKSGGCFGEIDRLLGYRLVLESATHGGTAVAGGALSFDATLKNVGYAALYNPRVAYVVLQSTSDKPIRRALALPDDPRTWAAGAESKIHAALTLPADLPAGEYKVGLWLPDGHAGLQGRSEYAVRFANQGTWDGATGTNVLTTHVTVMP